MSGPRKLDPLAAARALAEQEARRHVLPPAASAQQTRRDPDERDRRRFEQALEGTPPHASAATQADSDTRDDPREQGRQRVLDCIERLYVGRHGAEDVGDHQVSIVLADDLLSGVMLTVRRQRGQLQVSFDCTHDPSRAWLEHEAPLLARRLAQRLGEHVVLHVRAGGAGGANSLLEAQGDPGDAS